MAPFGKQPFWARLASMIAVVAILLANRGQAEEYPTIEQLPTQDEPPDPLIFLDGTPVRTPADWENRRAELKRLFSHYMYGRTPPKPESVTGIITRTDTGCFAGKATLQEIEIQFAPEPTPKIYLLLFTPNQRTRPSPLIVGLNFCGNHTVIKDSQIRLPTAWVRSRCGNDQNQATEAGRGMESDVWCIENTIDHGYAIGTFYYGDIDPDRDDFSDGVHPHFLPAGITKLGAHDWGSIAAWAWGLQRAIDYLCTREEFDKGRIIAMGHSRLGKTALVAAAFDERIALVVPHQSGTGGCAMSRGNNQETVKKINDSFPHWFNDYFTNFNERENKLPVDQHLLVALVAPRFVLDTEGDKDVWANYDNALLSLRGADKVYKFLGRQGLVGQGVVRDDEPFNGSTLGDLAQYRIDSEHVLNLTYWNKILEFADLKLGKP